VGQLEPFEWVVTWTDPDRQPTTVVADEYAHVDGFFHFSVAYSSVMGDSDEVFVARDTDVSTITRGNRVARQGKPQPTPGSTWCGWRMAHWR